MTVCVKFNLNICFTLNTGFKYFYKIMIIYVGKRRLKKRKKRSKYKKIFYYY